VTELTSPVVAGPEQPGRPQVPDQRGTEALPTSAQEARPQRPVAQAPTMPAQRAGEEDRPKPSVAGPGTAHKD